MMFVSCPLHLKTLGLREMAGKQKPALITAGRNYFGPRVRFCLLHASFKLFFHAATVMLAVALQLPTCSLATQ